jgi:uncharacterized protein
MKCFYHAADFDGRCSAAIVKYFNPDCELIGINYGDEFPWYEIKFNETVYMLDFSLQPFIDMIKLRDRCNLIWIDHHISAIKDMENSKLKFDGIQKDGIGACNLTWNYFSENKVPLSVKLLAEYDVWIHDDERTLPFQYGLKTEETIPNNLRLWKRLFEDENFVGNIIYKGEYILKYVENENNIYCKSCSFETELEGYKCIAINKMITNSKMFDGYYDNKIHDIMLTFGFRNGSYTVSLYTDKESIDVSIIAKKYNGGGHKQAAGFQCLELPFKFPFKS